jgi:hypothetical protein
MVATLHQVGAQVGAHKSGATRDEDAVGFDAGLGLDDRRFLRASGESGVGELSAVDEEGVWASRWGVREVSGAGE